MLLKISWNLIGKNSKCNHHVVLGVQWGIRKHALWLIVYIVYESLCYLLQSVLQGFSILYSHEAEASSLAWFLFNWLSFEMEMSNKRLILKMF